MALDDNAREMAVQFLDFLNRSPTPYHDLAVSNAEQLLKDAGFLELDESEHYRAMPRRQALHEKGLLRSGTTLFAFAVGGRWEEAVGGENDDAGGGISMMATHTDSCCLRVKPVSRKTGEEFLQLGVAPYGGGICRSWFDRDLSMAGLMVLRRDGERELLEQRLVDLRRPILHIPSLAIHLDSLKGNETEFNLETHMCPIMAMACTSTANTNKEEKAQNASETQTRNCSILTDHHPQLLRVIAAEAGCRPEELVDLDLYLYDTQPAVLTGLNSEFISGARLDNLVSTFCAVRALIDSCTTTTGPDTLATDSNIRLVACYDNEEVGSESAQGAMRSVTEWLLRRLCQCRDDPCTFERVIGRSFLISADKAHATHPNYPERHEDNHRPRFGAGPVVKYNLCNLRFASSALTEAVVRVIAERAQVPLQRYIFRNDAVRGSTIGPMLAARLGIQTVDIGCQPQLAMHSIRELGDAVGIFQSVQLFQAFFNELPSVLGKIRKI